MAKGRQKRSKKPPRRKKLEKKTTIRNRLMRLWVEKVRILHGDRCAVCGRAYGDIDAKGKECFLNAHHIDSRHTNPRLRWDALNGILLCPKHHKFSKNSAHKGSIWFITWLQKYRWNQYVYIMQHRDEEIDIDNRDTLAAIEARLRAEPTEAEMLVVRTIEQEGEKE
jgi:hypothetical protein